MLPHTHAIRRQQVQSGVWGPESQRVPGSALALFYWQLPSLNPPSPLDAARRIAHLLSIRTARVL